MNLKSIAPERVTDDIYMFANKVVLTLMTRTVTHDGYCSDTENEVSVSICLKVVPLPETLQGKLRMGELLSKNNYPLFPEHDKETDIEVNGSYNCTPSEYWPGLERHSQITEIICGVGIYEQ